MIVAVILAAGQGKRLGGPKALLLVEGAEERPLIEVQCRARLAGESGRALAVVRGEVAGLVGERLRAVGAEVVVSLAADEVGPAGSLAAAAAWLETAAEVRAVVVTPVDVVVGDETVRALVEGLLRPVAGPGPLAVVPRFGGRGGHPVVLHPAALARYREPDPPPLRDHLRGLGARVVALEVGDARIGEDLDFAHQTAALARITGGDGPPRFFGRRGSPLSDAE